MVQIAACEAVVTGDIGGAGISRWWWQRSDAGTIQQADCNSAMTAVGAFYAAIKGYMPNDITWSFTQPVLILDEASGLVQNILTPASPPANAVGSGGGNYAAGVGARLNLRTLSIHGRRFIKGCVFLVPLSSVAFTVNGVISSTVNTAIGTAYTTYVGALTTAGLEQIVWHRPPKGTNTGGAVGLVTSAQVNATPAGLRSRRS